MPVQVTMSRRNAYISELFSSIQGEGLFVGLRQIFIRFHGCNLACNYCDTKSSGVPESCMLEGTPGRRDFSFDINPVSIERVITLINRWQKGWPNIHHSISITGGEPLLNYELLLDWLPDLRKTHPIYLESNGVLHNALERVISHIDHISMDIKLPSTSGLSNLWDHHRDFLQIASLSDVFVKAVIDRDTEGWEVMKSCEIIASVNKYIPFILQPLTLKDGSIGISPIRILELQEMASAILSKVRVIPQTHKFIGQL